MEITPHKKALGYIRISSYKQINGESPQTQKEAIEDYAKANGIEIVDWYFDEAKSGKNTDRVELQNLIAEATRRKGNIDHVLVYKMNRASRDIASYVTGLYVKLRALGITVRSATENFDDTPQGHMMEMFHVMVGQLDNETKRGVTIDNMRRLASQGYWQNAPVYGYEVGRTQNIDGKSRSVLIPNNKAPLVKEVLERFSQGDMTKADLTRYAKSIGLTNKKGKLLGADRIHHMLKNPAYAGYVASNHTDWELVEGKHEGLISKEVYELNQTLLFGKKIRAGEKRKAVHPDYPLKGLILCPNCGLPLYASAPQTGAGGKSPRYHCSRKSCKGKVKSIKAETVHTAFAALLADMKPDDKVLGLYRETLITESQSKLGQMNAKIGRVRSRLSDVDAQKLKILKKFANDEISSDEKVALTTDLELDRATLSEELNELLRLQGVEEFHIDYAIEVMQNVDQQWVNSSIESKVRFQNTLFPNGLTLNGETGMFGTTAISPLYRYTANEKDPEGSSKSHLVAGAGFEPAT